MVREFDDNKDCKIPGLDQVFHRILQGLADANCTVNLQVGMEGAGWTARNMMVEFLSPNCPLNPFG